MTFRIAPGSPLPATRFHASPAGAQAVTGSAAAAEAAQASPSAAALATTRFRTRPTIPLKPPSQVFSSLRAAPLIRHRAARENERELVPAHRVVLGVPVAAEIDLDRAVGALADDRADRRRIGERLPDGLGGGVERDGERVGPADGPVAGPVA